MLLLNVRKCLDVQLEQLTEAPILTIRRHI